MLRAYFNLGKYFSTGNNASAFIQDPSFSNLCTLLTIDEIIHFSELIKQEDSINSLSNFLTLDEISNLIHLENEEAFKSFILSKVDSDEQRVYSRIKSLPIEKNAFSKLGFYDLLYLSLSESGKFYKSLSIAEGAFINSVFNFITYYKGTNKSIQAINLDFKMSIASFSAEFSFLNWQIGKYNNENKSPFNFNRFNDIGYLNFFSKDVSNSPDLQIEFFKKISEEAYALYISQGLPFNYILHLVSLDEHKVFGSAKFAIEAEMSYNDFLNYIAAVKKNQTNPIDPAVFELMHSLKNPILESSFNNNGNNSFTIEADFLDIQGKYYLLEEKFEYVKSLLLIRAN